MRPIGGSAVGLAVGWNVDNVGALAETVAEGYGVDLATVGVLTTVLFLVHLLVQLPAGRVVDARGARPMAIVALAVLAGSNAIGLISADLGVGLACRALTGIGTSLAFIAASDYVRASGGSALGQGIFGGVNLGAAGLALAIVPIFDGGPRMAGAFRDRDRRRARSASRHGGEPIGSLDAKR